MKNKKCKIQILPYSDHKNPFQTLTINVLKTKYEICPQNDFRFFTIIRNKVLNNPDIYYFDWIEKYYIGKSVLITFMKSISFMIDLYISKKLLNVKIYWSMHNIINHENKYERLAKIIKQQFAKNCLKIRIFDKESLKTIQKYLKTAPKKLLTIHEGTYIGYYPDNISRRLAKRKLNLFNDKFIFLFFGTIREYKGIDNLINAFKKLNNNKSILIIAGNPVSKSYSTKIINLINETTNIYYYPKFIPKNEVQYFFKASDCVVLPFKEISNSGSVILSMGFSKPIITLNSGSNRERLINQKKLLYENKFNVTNEIYKKLSYVIKLDKKVLKKYGESNRYILNNYKWEDILTLFK